MRFHVTADEYLKYNYYNLKDRCRKNFVLGYHRKRYVRLVTRFFTASKYLLHNRIPDLYQREMLLLPFCGLDEFLAFAKKRKKIMTKPDTGTLGMGVEPFEYTDDEAAKKFFERASADKAILVEEYICQHEKLNQFNPSSVNTIRVITVLYDGAVELVAAALKTGGSKNRCVDNLNHGGYGAQVDIKTGIVMTDGKDVRYNSYTYHPVSGVQFRGFCIPHWERVVELVKLAHTRLPQCLIYGWDVAITPTGVELVEANNAPGTNLLSLDGVPRGEKIVKMVKTIKLKQNYSRAIKFVPDYKRVFPAYFESDK